MLSNLLNDYSICNFHSKLSSEISDSANAYSYLGLNFKESEILSYKLYYTFFDLQSVKHFFPIPELKERFLSYENKFSNHISTPRVPGCGITFTIKFDTKTQQTSQGVYFRIIEPTERYITKFLNSLKIQGDEHYHKFACDSHLKYLSVDSNSIVRERNYIYCNHPDFLNQFNQKSGIPFSQSNCLEISTDWEDINEYSNIRFIGLGDLQVSEVTGKEINDMIRIIGNAFLSKNELFKAYGYYIFKDVKSVFFFDTQSISDVVSKLIEKQWS